MTVIIKNDLSKIGLYFVLTVCGGALLSPALFFAGKEVAASGALEASGWEPLQELGRILEETNFQRYFNRAMLVSALVCLIPLLKWLKLFNRSSLALERDPSRWRHLAGGFAMAAGLLLFMGWIFVLTGVFDPRAPEDRDPLWLIMRGAMISAVAVALIEEFLFRGVMLGVCLRAARESVALFFVTFIFAAVHFLKPPDYLRILDTDVGWGTGFWIVGKCFGQFADPRFIAAEFATLFAVGWVLAKARLRTRSLWVSIGLHGGWVFGLKTFAAVTMRTAPLQDTLPWAGGDLKTGVIALLVVVLTGWLTQLWLRESEPGELGVKRAVSGEPSRRSSHVKATEREK